MSQHVSYLQQTYPCLTDELLNELRTNKGFIVVTYDGKDVWSSGNQSAHFARDVDAVRELSKHTKEYIVFSWFDVFGEKLVRAWA